jgi:hypothetical protein
MEDARRGGAEAGASFLQDFGCTRSRRAELTQPLPPGLLVSLPQHSDEHRSGRPILFAVDQKLGEGAVGFSSNNSTIRAVPWS